MKKILCVFLSLILIVSLNACRKEKDTPVSSETMSDNTTRFASSSETAASSIPESTTAALSEETTAPTESHVTPATELPEETTLQTASPTESPEETVVTQPAEYLRKETLSFEDLKFSSFHFSSGAGAWRTILTIQPDGDFSGFYHDSNMGETGDRYPDGTVYRSDFTGKFSQPVKVDEYTYSITLEQIRYQRQPRTEEIQDSVLYHYTEAYGLDGSKEFLIYLPGTPLDLLPKPFLLWTNLVFSDHTELPYYGLYAPETENGFSSFDIVENIRTQVSITEWADGNFVSKLQEADTQTDINILTSNHYLLWDELLNELWAVLNQVLDEESMQLLTSEELAWIAQKEQAVADAGAGYEGGTLYASIASEVAADMTKNRVYELMEYLP